MTRNAPWFVNDFMPRWLDHVMTPSGAVVEALDIKGHADAASPSTLTQARTIFALAQLYLARGDEQFQSGACTIYVFMDDALRDPSGGYLANCDNTLRRTYDQSFALLALTTLRKISPQTVPESRINDLWNFVQGTLTDPETGALWEDSAMAAQGARAGDLRAQNPHMHMLEAVLQAFEMTADPVWMDRATHLVQLAARYFVDPQTGAIIEFVGPDLAPLTTTEGGRREPGHQYEWAWLLHRYVAFGGDDMARAMADRMIHFVEATGLRGDGVLKGAPFDALDAAGRVTEASHLLWPLTEAGKYDAATGAADRARDIEAIIFERYFAAGSDPVWCNQLDSECSILWPTALSRLIYHVVLFVTEGQNAGLWQLGSGPINRI
ncbi:AGE family epimerase/isomerase [Loktanella salsilacus]|uniref:AGE family epimerase/isomerase n=1 Tax=Loktanella salsilacus TaxID=195913 RepID=UPI0030019639